MVKKSVTDLSVSSSRQNKKKTENVDRQILSTKQTVEKVNIGV